MERRDFLKLIGVTGAGVATACDQKYGPQALIPYVVPPDDITPGVATWYASTCRECPAGCGTHVKTREGRVIKIEGNPDSPINRGRLCARGQTAHQQLYDPDRLVGPQRLGGGAYQDVAWDEAEALLARELGAARATPGAIVLLTGLQTGTREQLYDEWAAALGATRVVYEPFAHEAALEANRRVFGTATLPTYDIAGAEFVISFGADFLETWVSPVRYGREWSAMHAFRGETGRGVFVAVEPRLSMTASNADEWVSAKPGTEYLVALAMANVLGAGGEAAAWTPARASEATGVPAATIERLARLFGDRRSVALPGGVSTAHAQATAACVAVNLLNQAGGAVGDTVRHGSPITGAVAGSYRAMVDLTSRMKTGQVRALLIAEANPAYALPPGLGFVEALRQVPFRVSFSPIFDETASHCHLLLPDHTPLESWGDWVPEAGVASLVQPAMRPGFRFNSRAMPDVLLNVHRALQSGAAGAVGGAAPLAGAAPATSASLAAENWFEYLRAAWRGRAPTELAWTEVLKAGGVWQGAGAGAGSAGGTAAQPASAPAGASAAATVGAMAAGAASPSAADGEPFDFAPPVFDGPTGADSLTLLVFPQLAMYDGRTANRPTLQELPDPATTVSWQTWAELSPATASRLGVKDGDLLAVESPYGRVEVSAIVYPGARDDTVAMPLGRGHTGMGRYAAETARGANPVTLLPPTADPASGQFVYQSVRVTVAKTGGWTDPLRHQGSDTQHERGLAQAIPMAEALRLEPERQRAEASRELSRQAADSDRESPYRWGLSINLDSCTGCNACVAACAAENNIPFVGPVEVAKSRQMQWIRIERFFEEGPGGAPAVRHMPMMCQHCGAAPCEPVCPVYATYHNPDGLNVQVYNRCVGTRYCSNNCPYKVRYFNWRDHEWPEPLNWALNPDVTTREKGVMEKCTYCVQRINAAKITIRDQGPDAVIPDGMFQTACQQTCPTEAIVFGNLKDPESRVATLARGPLAYNVLDELNTRPANFYLKQVTGRLEPELA